MTEKTARELAEELAREWRERADSYGEDVRDDSDASEQGALRECAAELLKKFGIEGT